MNVLRNKFKSYEEGLNAWLEANEAIYGERPLGPWTKGDEEIATERFQELWNAPELTEMPHI